MPLTHRLLFPLGVVANKWLGSQVDLDARCEDLKGEARKWSIKLVYDMKKGKEKYTGCSVRFEVERIVKGKVCL